jgi:hypothetical protein
VRISCVLEFPYADERTARAVRDALAPDDAGFVRSRTEGALVIAEMEADTPMRLLHTVEDYLACVAVAEKAVEAAAR